MKKRIIVSCALVAFAAFAIGIARRDYQLTLVSGAVITLTPFIWAAVSALLRGRR